MVNNQALRRATGKTQGSAAATSTVQGRNVGRQRIARPHGAPASRLRAMPGAMTSRPNISTATIASAADMVSFITCTDWLIRIGSNATRQAATSAAARDNPASRPTRHTASTVTSPKPTCSRP